jgi:hypothetical protein
MNVCLPNNKRVAVSDSMTALIAAADVACRYGEDSLSLSSSKCVANLFLRALKIISVFYSLVITYILFILYISHQAAEDRRLPKYKRYKPG